MFTRLFPKSDQTIQLRPYRELIHWLWENWKGFRLQTFIFTTIGFLYVLVGLASVWASKWAIDVATDHSLPQSLRLPVIAVITLTLLRIVLNLSEHWLASILEVKANNHMTRRLFERVVAARWMEAKQFHSGDLRSRLGRDLRTVSAFLTDRIPALFNAVMQFLGAFAFLFYMNQTMAIILILVLPVTLVFYKFYMQKMRRRTHRVRETENRIASYIQESLQHLVVIKTLPRIGMPVQKLISYQRDLQEEVIRNTQISTLTASIKSLGLATGYLIIFIWGIVSLHHQEISYGTLIAFVQLVGQIQNPILKMSGFVSQFVAVFTATERLMALEDIPAEQSTRENRLTGQCGITLRNVTFTYAADERRVLEHFDCTLAPGSVTAVVGETGTGKTTFLRLLLALITPTEGQVALTDENGREYPCRADTRCNFAYVPQGNTLLSGTVRENLLYAKEGATDAEMERALRAAAADFVLALPEGLGTVCGERGEGLSEGQAQRIAIARALLKDSPILILDEATSALDANTEKIVLNNITEQYQGRTIIFVTHRSEALQYSSTVLRL